MLFEFAPDLRVVMVNDTGEVVADLPLHQLLLHGFSPAKLHE